MGEMEKKLKGITKMSAVIAIAAIVVVAAVVGAYWFYFRPSPTPPGISSSISPGEVEPGESVAVSGSTSPVIANSTVTLTYTRPDGSNFTKTVTSDSDGKFTDTYSSAPTDPTGKWTVTAEIEGEIGDPASFYIFVSPPIKIGVIRNLFIQGQGMEEASTMAMEEINDAGGIKVDGDQGRKIVLKFGDEGTEPATGKSEIERLITVEKVDFMVGGFRTEILFPMREVAMDHKKIFITTGAATNELYNCKGSLTVQYPCGQCVRCDYDRYKYMFRVMPPNSTLLFLRTLIPYITEYLVPEVFGGTLESKTRVAAVIEDLSWADVVAHVVQNLFPVVFGNATKSVYVARPSNTETNFEGILTAIEDSEAEIVIHVFSGEAGLAFIKQWGERQIPALPVGVNVLSQNNEMWDDTEGKCEYEVFLSSPPRVNLTEGLIPWWDRYVERWGHDPLYTSLGTYDAVYTLKFGVEKAGSIDSAAVVEALEGSERDTLMGRASFTQYHDVLIREPYPMDKYPEWVTPLIVQWREGQREVLFPFNRPYTKELELPPWMQ